MQTLRKGRRVKVSNIKISQAGVQPAHAHASQIDDENEESTESSSSDDEIPLIAITRGKHAKVPRPLQSTEDDSSSGTDTPLSKQLGAAPAGREHLWRSTQNVAGSSIEVDEDGMCSGAIYYPANLECSRVTTMTP